MQELIKAAKAVIDAADRGDRWCAIANLKTAVERAEKQCDITLPVTAFTDEISRAYEGGYNAGQRAEQERITSIIKSLDAPCENLIKIIETADYIKTGESDDNKRC